MYQGQTPHLFKTLFTLIDFILRTT